MAKKKTTKKRATPQNHNINVNMQDRMVAVLDELVEATGSSTRAELVRILVRQEAERRNIPLERKRARRR